MAGPQKKSSAQAGEISLGWVVGVFGTEGEVRLHLHNRDSTLLAEGFEVTLVDPEGSRRTARVSSRSGAGGRVLGRIDGVSGREGARSLMGTELVLSRADLPKPEAGEYYHVDLIGLDVWVEGGGSVGTLQEIQEANEVDIWVIEAEDGPHFVPALSERIVGVDLEAGRVVVTEDAWNSSS
ncbi:MAG: ribosome maturation factor RimM [Myxococcota bacterium]|nr:ribosome maturation factor RimM [Myxococcota bacterium]